MAPVLGFGIAAHGSRPLAALACSCRARASNLDLPEPDRNIHIRALAHLLPLAGKSHESAGVEMASIAQSLPASSANHKWLKAWQQLGASAPTSTPATSARLSLWRSAV